MPAKVLTTVTKNFRRALRLSELMMLLRGASAFPEPLRKGGILLYIYFFEGGE